ncbi:MAG: hypothetical protein HOP28_00280 [Gemmatimonadales bacterium]|nr:hypothetical protein [Gemmatimonadales bacterium]
MACSSSGKFPWNLLGWATLSALLAIGSGILRRTEAVPQSLAWLVAILPVAPMVGYFFGVERWMRQLDEMQRMIQLEALLIQFGVTAILVMGYGTLARAGAVPDLPISRSWHWLWFALFWSWLLGQGIVRRKYR